MNKKIHYTDQGAGCFHCHEVLLKYPFEDGDQHRAMSKHECPNDRAHKKLAELSVKLEEFLKESGISLEVGVSAPVDAWLELHDNATGVSVRLGDGLG